MACGDRGSKVIKLASESVPQHVSIVWQLARHNENRSFIDESIGSVRSFNVFPFSFSLQFLVVFASYVNYYRSHASFQSGGSQPILHF